MSPSPHRVLARIRPWLALPIAALVALLGQARAYADDADDAVRAAVFIMPTSGEMSRATRATLQLMMEEAFAERPRVHLVDVDERLADRAGRVPDKDIARARSRLDAGIRALGQGRAAKAVPHLEAAVEVLETNLVHLGGVDELARAQAALGAAYSRSDRRDDAVSLFRRLAAWRPDHSFADLDTSQAVTGAWRDARNAVSRRGRGSLRLETQPSGAVAFVDGRFVGFTPTSVEDTQVGTHYVSFRMPGYYPTAVPVRVRSRGAKLETRLEPAERSEQVDGLARAVAAVLASNADGPRALQDLRDLLAIDQALVVRVPSIEDEDGVYVAAVFDTQSRKRLAQAEAPASDDIEALFRDLVQSLYAGIELQSAGAGGAPGRDGASGDRPIYKRWWFWTGIAVATAAAVAVPLYLGRDADGPCPVGSSCGQFEWRF